MPTEAGSHRRIAELSITHDDLALIWLAESIELNAILTLDVHDFSLYRIKGRKSFELVDWH